jgi:hypothetical protein
MVASSGSWARTSAVHANDSLLEYSYKSHAIPGRIPYSAANTEPQDASGSEAVQASAAAPLAGLVAAQRTLGLWCK